MKSSLQFLSYCFFFLIIITLIGQTFSKPTNDRQLGEESDGSNKHQSIYYAVTKTIREIEWLLNQLIDILSEMVSGLESDPSLLSNYHFRQILAHMIRRIDFILEHFENVDDLPSEIKNDLQRLDCVRIRLSNYINKDSDEQIDDSACKTHKHKTTTPKTVTSGTSNDNMLVIITQIVYIIVQIVNQMGSVNKPDHGWSSPDKATTANLDNMLSEIMTHMKSTTPKTSKTKQTTKAPMKTTTLNWEDMISQIMGQMSSTSGTESPIMTSTMNWGNLISEIMAQMSSTSMSPMSGSTSAPLPATTIDWGELISAVVGQIENQFGTTATPQTQSRSTPSWDSLISAIVWEQNKNTTMTTQSVESTTFDVQACIDSIMKIISDINSQMPDTMATNTTITTTTTLQPQQTTQDLESIMSGILGQFG